jgi:spore germination cell wall hydrolase CwlJ-like protein
MRKAKLILLGSFISICSLIGLGSTIEQNKIMEIAYSDLTKDAKKQVDCLAENIYHEAGYESEKGKQAVALVTLNRTQDERFPSQICEVVKQKTQGTCQFSWFCMPVKLNRNTDAYKQSMEVALFVYANYEKLKDVTDGALYYHADYVNPRWRNVEKTTVIGRHIFYKEKLKI